MAIGPWGGAGNVPVFKVTHTFKLGQSLCQTGYHIRGTVSAAPTAAAVLAQASIWATTNLRSLLYSADQLIGTDVVDLVTALGASQSHNNQAGTIAVSTPSQIPSFMAVTVALKGELRKRYGQGRMFLPLRIDQWVDGDALNADAATAYNAALAALDERFVQGVTNPNMKLANVHAAKDQRGTPGAPGYRPALPAQWYDVTSMRLNTTVTALRSRKVNVGS